MPQFVSLLFLAVFAVVSSALTWAADPNTYGTFALFEVDNQWRNLPAEERQKAGKEAQALLESNKPQVTVDSYWTYGLTTNSQFMLRLHSQELQANQQLLTQLLETGLGRHLNLEYTVSGVTKSLNYAPDFPELLEKMKAAEYKGDPSTYFIMIPVRKNAEWWNLPQEERVALMKEHTIPTVAYLEKVKRKLYHSTGISDVDFLTYFETNSLMDFNNLVIELRMVKEDKFNVQLGEPTIIGTLKNWNDIVNLLVK